MKAYPWVSGESTDCLRLHRGSAEPRCRLDVRLFLRRAGRREAPVCRLGGGPLGSGVRAGRATNIRGDEIGVRMSAQTDQGEAAPAAPRSGATPQPAARRGSRSRRKVTIAQIAQETGLSTATVSKVLNGKPDVSARTPRWSRMPS